MRVSSLARGFLLTLFLIAFGQIAFSQNSLQPGIPVERRIAAGQTHRYNVTLQQDQYLRLLIEQKGIDLGIRVSEPDGRRIGDFDNPSGASGPETVAFVAESAGEYAIEILPLDEFRNPAPGRYEIRIAELRKATEAELRNGKTREALRVRALALLNDLLEELPSIHNLLQRLDYETRIAGLLWGFDEKRAAALLQDAAENVREILARNGNSRFGADQNAMQLRREIVEQMADHEPEAALTFARSTRSPQLLQHSGFQERDLDLAIATKLVERNPKAAFQIVQDSLKDGFSQAVFAAVQELRIKNPELAAILVHDLIAKLIVLPLIDVPENAEIASSLVQLTRPPGKFAEVSLRTGGGNLPADSELRGLLQKMVAEVVSFSPPDSNAYSGRRAAAQKLIDTLKRLSGEFQVIAPENLVAIEQRLSAKIVVPPEYLSGFTSVVTIIDTQGAAQDVFHRQAIQSASSNRNFEEAFQQLDLLPANERAGYIENIVSEIGPGLKRSTAVMFLDRARRVLPSSPRAEDGDELETLLAFVSAYSRLDPNRGFEIVEPLVDQLNDLIASAVTLNGFGETYFRDGEFIMSNGNSVADSADKIAKSLGSLALVNFQRAKSDADRIRTSTVRIEMYLQIAERAISGSEEED